MYLCTHTHICTLRNTHMHIKGSVQRIIILLWLTCIRKNARCCLLVLDLCTFRKPSSPCHLCILRLSKWLSAFVILQVMITILLRCHFSSNFGATSCPITVNTHIVSSPDAFHRDELSAAHHLASREHLPPREGFSQQQHISPRMTRHSDTSLNGSRKKPQQRENHLVESLFSTRRTSPSGKEATRGYLPRARVHWAARHRQHRRHLEASLMLPRPFMHVDQSLPVGGGHQAVH